jgi:hypothetical protein
MRGREIPLVTKDAVDYLVTKATESLQEVNMRNSFVFIFLCLLALSCSTQQSHQTALDQATKKILVNYLVENYQTPEDYVISCFEDHDIVFLGEYHRIKHDVELIHNLIPRLHEHGIYNLGIEFADFQDQERIDRLITSPEYDESLAQQIQFDNWPFWGFREYVDIFKVAWQVNHDLAPDAPRFRVIGLNGKSDWSYVWTEEDRRNPEVMKKVWPYGDSDEHMAKVILREFVDKGQKALVYSGMYHAFTKFHQPVYDADLDSVVRRNDERMGNRVYKAIGDRCMTICLHCPWPKYKQWDEEIYPVDGVIDALMPTLAPQYRRIGFDVTGTPFASLKADSCYWRVAYDNFTLADYCDGYIYQKPLGEYEGVTVIDNFINESNRLAAIAQSANPQFKDSSRTVEDLMSSLQQDTDFARRFRQFAEGPPEL